jgi:hypothetical protein
MNRPGSTRVFILRWNALLPALGLWALLGVSGCSVALPAMALRIGPRSAPAPEALRRVSPGRTITVGLRSGESVTGRYLGPADAGAGAPRSEPGPAESFSLDRGAGPVVIAWADVRWIRTAPAWRTMLPAFLVGITLDYLAVREVLDAYGRGTDL